jgi:hypothetical protein
MDESQQVPLRIFITGNFSIRELNVAVRAVKLPVSRYYGLGFVYLTTAVFITLRATPRHSVAPCDAIKC